MGSTAIRGGASQLPLISFRNVVHPAAVGRADRVLVLPTFGDLFQIAAAGIHAPDVVTLSAAMKHKFKHNRAAVGASRRIAVRLSFVGHDYDLTSGPAISWMLTRTIQIQALVGVAQPKKTNITAPVGVISASFDF